MHDARPLVVAHGFGTVVQGSSMPGRILARWLGFPASGPERPLRVEFQAVGSAERLSRHYPDRTLATIQAAGGPDGSGLLSERFGPFHLLIQLRATKQGLEFDLRSVRVGGAVLPKSLRPRLFAREFDEDGWYRFDVRVELPLIGLLIAYRGRLMPE
jgi:hypothetical protein